MVEQIEELETDSHFAGLPVWDVEVLDDGTVGIKILRAGNLVPSLLAESRDGRTELRRRQTRCRYSARQGSCSCKVKITTHYCYEGRINEDTKRESGIVFVV